MPAGGIPPALGTINYEAQHGQIKRQSEHLCLVAIDTLDPYVRRGQEGHGVGDVVKAPRGEHLPQVLLWRPSYRGHSGFRAGNAISQTRTPPAA